LQSEVISTFLETGVEVVLLVDDDLVTWLGEHYGQTGLIFEGLRLDQARAYAQQKHPSVQYWLDFLRRAGGSTRINLQAVEGYVNQVDYEARGRRRILMNIMKGILGITRRSRIARWALVQLQSRYNPCLYADLFDHYQPALVIGSTPGWRLDRYLLREAASRGIRTAAVIVGWDNSSSYFVPGAKVDWVTCWSEIQKRELVLGSDWQPERVNIGGIPAYDGYFTRKWVIPRETYFQQHGLDPQRRLISYASSFITFSPNIENIRVLAGLVSSDQLIKPSQLLIRLHPNHFLDVPRFKRERGEIQALVQDYPHVHLVEPVPMGGEMGHYSGEDMPEKSSMMAHSDVMVTVYSTMLVEAMTHGTPVVSSCIDVPGGWPDAFSLPLVDIGDWPTHDRFRQSEVGRVALNQDELLRVLNYYLVDPDLDRQARDAFITGECTYTDGSASKRTAKYLLSLMDGQHAG
jgi:hypothetical protein